MGKQPKTTNWMISGICQKTKDRFMGLCKMQNKDWKEVLTNLMKTYIWDNKKDA